MHWYRITPTWLPTPGAINDLPEPLRRYIKDLQTNADPAGMVAENTLLRDQNRQLQEKLIGEQSKHLVCGAPYCNEGLCLRCGECPKGCGFGPGDENPHDECVRLLKSIPRPAEGR